MINEPIHHRTTLGPGRSLTDEWEPLAEWHSRWVAASNVTGRRTVISRHASYTEARMRVAREALARRAADFRAVGA